ncbi:MAG: hypothetical protein COV55_02440 [Candidatus Komeilibacteria bacterium CG11_big_fil_rev_8_21_14_0_20_36_20]|uniref:Zn-dependent hydrolase n=1 Tax=Candidatus Komeilibacteria bacterium CG11_big_fil_rev_8_21_14_0_20_36_20 TaxID=1974477 RepID=A0A2H0NFE9_9BACT|nr:MAG: hypothetical protein COV55_02440 [Candidatus Komeilibacteria bacterium CG11_big_fil_rev_8_21_14_0_20_36_20]PIR81832.1 MAG: hypothetical protein COU21_01500 [Candidatus Komeilibacteria bacterium CG10_big_fil_rev_8_21_14_0_10_36_65]PJC55322.1 MAG: hypothetical protein CO027_02835 [Candidatus Komeilibacteria bacterium CG_4_9_14_0_2_um_filter_36_13]
MIISWHGFNYFKVQNSHRSIVLNPYSLDKTTKLSKTKADIVIFSDPTKLAASKFDKDAFVINSPGEYEANNVFIYGEKVKGNIVYLIVFEDIKLAFLGEFGHQELTNGDIELIEGADILILPVGGGELTNIKEAMRIINQVDPRVVIPSCHAAGSFKLKAENVSQFIKEFGVRPEEMEKYKIQQKDLPQDDMKLIVLNLKQ